MRRTAAPLLLAAWLGLVGLLPACGGSPSEEAEDLCHDLGNLRGTIGFLANPSAEATVGLVRSAVDKLEPTFTRIAEGDAVPTPIGDRLMTAQAAYAAVLKPYGDDEPIAGLRLEIAQPSRRLTDGVDEVEAALGCED